MSRVNLTLTMALWSIIALQSMALTGDKPTPPAVVVELSLTPQVLVRDEPLQVDYQTPTIHGPMANPTFQLRTTAYNSMVSQTNAQPFITATGARTDWGVIAVSRDLLSADIPYGTLVRLRDLGRYADGAHPGQYQALLDAHLFIVEDTMNIRKRQQLDIWFDDHASALAWGVRLVEVEVVRYGRDGPLLELNTASSDFQTSGSFLAGR
jgi:3D (Asp-Asp-Asp) domain-containing protein